MARMSRSGQQSARKSAIERAERFAPFLREALIALPGIGEIFLESGAAAAAAAAFEIDDEELEPRLRRQRHALALAVALGDLSGEMPLEQVTRLLSDFADSAIDDALSAAISDSTP